MVRCVRVVAIAGGMHVTGPRRWWWLGGEVGGGDGGFCDGEREVNFAVVEEGWVDEYGRGWLDGVRFWAWGV